MFSKRMRLVVAAKDYEVRCERTIAMETSKRMLQEMGQGLRIGFNSEVHCMKTQYTKLLTQLDIFENTIKKQSVQVALQELIIQKLSATLFQK
jgi:hypothetical protein